LAARFAATVPPLLRVPPTVMPGLPTSRVKDLGTLDGDDSAAIVLHEIASVAGSTREWQECWLPAPIEQET